MTLSGCCLRLSTTVRSSSGASAIGCCCCCSTHARACKYTRHISTCIDAFFLLLLFCCCCCCCCGRRLLRSANYALEKDLEEKEEALHIDTECRTMDRTSREVSGHLESLSISDDDKYEHKVVCCFNASPPSTCPLYLCVCVCVHVCACVCVCVRSSISSATPNDLMQTHQTMALTRATPPQPLNATCFVCALLLCSGIDPSEWDQTTQDNLDQAEQERTNSGNLREDIDDLLKSINDRLTQQANTVCTTACTHTHTHTRTHAHTHTHTHTLPVSLCLSLCEYMTTTTNHHDA